jgi:hypothetical protein
MRKTVFPAALVASILATAPAVAQWQPFPPPEKPAAPAPAPAPTPAPAPPAKPAMAAPAMTPVVTIGKTELSVGGFLRLRSTSTFDYEIDSSQLTDESRTFMDARSYLTLQAKHGPVLGVLSLDLAGDDFNDGVKWGNPGNPGYQSTWNVQTRLAYVQWNTKRVSLLFGRMPARLGNGIVANVNRDAGRIVLKTGIGNFIGTAVKGADDRTVPGTEGGLDAYILLHTGKPWKKGGKSLNYQAWIGQQDPTERPGLPLYPSKLIVGTSFDVKLDKLMLKLEGTYLGGDSGGPKAAIRDNEAGMFWLDSDYQLNEKVALGGMFGYGTGDNNPTDDTQNNFQAFFLDENSYTYTNIYSDDLQGFRGAFPGSVNFGSGFANTLFLQAHVRAQVNPKTEITGSYTYLRANKAQRVGAGPTGNRSTTQTATTQDIGHEIDANVSYKIVPAATLWLRTGLLLTGDIWGKDASDVGKVEAFVELKF